MSQTAWLNPASTSEDASRGSSVWQPYSLGDGVSDNGTYMSGSGIYPFSATIRTGSVRLVKGGVISGNDLAATNTTPAVKGSDTDITFGSSTELWGLSLTPADVNASNFGVVWADDQTSYYAKALNFNPAIPTGAIIHGIEVIVQVRQFDNGFSYSNIAVDVIQMRVHYGTDHTINGGGNASGGLFYEMTEADKQNKLYQFKIYNKGAFLGEWTNEVATEPEFKLQINTIGTHMPIKLGRTLDTIQLVPEQLLDESGDDFLTEDGDTLIGFTGAGTALGPDSDADVNYDVNVNAYYGGYDYLITQDGEALITQDYELLMVVDGAPEGRSLITGFISKWQAGYSGDEAINTNLATYGWELNQLMLETQQEEAINNMPASITDSYPLAAPDGVGGTFHTLVQTFTAPATKKLASIKLKIARGAASSAKFGTGGPVTLSLYSGSTATGTPLATVTVDVSAWYNTNNASGYTEYEFAFADYISLTNAAAYCFKLTASNIKDFDYPIYVAEGSAYSGGAATLTNNVGSTTDGDVAMVLTWGSGVTTVPYTSADPSDIMRDIVDFAASKGAHISYTDDSIEDSNTSITYTFKTNTVTEAINKVLELAPADWYYYIDPADNVLYFKARPATPDHVFTLGKDIARFEIERDMEGIVNEAYLSGGGDPALFVKVTDQASQDEWRRGMTKMSDNRVTDMTSALILAQGAIDRNNDPQYVATLVVAAAVYDIETIKPGQLAALRGAGNFIDELELQISEVAYKFDTATLKLGTLKPPVSKRIEDLKRNLDVLEQQNNPTTPS